MEGHEHVIDVANQARPRNDGDPLKTRGHESEPEPEVGSYAMGTLAERRRQPGVRGSAGEQGDAGMNRPGISGG